MTLVPDFTLGERYRLQQRIAIGGMGEVWRATDVVLGRAVAVKVLKPEYAADPHFLERFRNEARHTAALSHPGIANVFDYGEIDDMPYLVMELVNGEPLSTVLARDGRLTPASTLDIVGQAGLALQAAHDIGVIHRDVKPGNILLRPDGVVKVTDFGIARAVGAAPVTQTGMLVGTAAYLSPEQASGHDVTPASDIYSLGVVAYECLAGDRPFRADSAVGVAMAHATATPPALPKDVPPLVADFVMRAMAKEPARRHPSAGDFGRTALALASSMHDGSAAPTTPADMDAASGGTRLLTTPIPPAKAATTLRSPAAVDDAQRRRVRNVFVAVGVAVVLLGFLLLRSCGTAAYARVPGVTGKPYAKAAAALDGVGLKAQRRTVHDPTTPAGVVLRQQPARGARISEGSTVTLTVSGGPRLVRVGPGLVGQQLAQVQRTLATEGLQVTVVRAPAPAAPGTVTAVAPTGALREGSTVTVTVAAVAPAPKKPEKPHGHGHEKHGH